MTPGATVVLVHGTSGPDRVFWIDIQPEMIFAVDGVIELGEELANFDTYRLTYMQAGLEEGRPPYHRVSSIDDELGDALVRVLEDIERLEPGAMGQIMVRRINETIAAYATSRSAGFMTFIDTIQLLWPPESMTVQHILDTLRLINVMRACP